MSDRFIQRELSWNDFNTRVLHEGLRPELELLDRLRFLAIVSSNYDEFFKVRVGGLMREAQNSGQPMDPSGHTPSSVLAELLPAVRKVAALHDTAVVSDILPCLEDRGLAILRPDRWSHEDKTLAGHFFEKDVFPLCTPIVLNEENSVIDHATRERICAAFSFSCGRTAIVPVPTGIKRFHDLRIDPEKRVILLLDDVLLEYAAVLFPGREIETRCLFRITQSADMTVDEERDEDFLAAMEEVLERRKTGFPVRIESSGNEKLANSIRELLGLTELHHFHLMAPLKFRDFSELNSLPGFDAIRTAKFQSIMPPFLDESDLWDTIKERDVLLYHPYDSFLPLIRMVEQAAEDTETLSIKMTLYRTSGDSPIVNALLRAAERGKQVTVLVELKARFNEGTNIHWASRLKKAGAIVIYGLVNLKVHAKALLIVRREEGILRRYLHLGTGNYNETTAKLYTDISLITSNETLTWDAAQMFNAITGYSAAPRLNRLIMAPFSLRNETLRLIRRETERAKNSEEAHILAKMNALVDEEIIKTLYEASCAGVKILLNIRGICCLRPGIEGLSENIRVYSIVDRFLEHARAFAYHNGGNTGVFLSSADWMTRNLDRRVEVLCPVLDPKHKMRIVHILESCFKDNCRSWELQADGRWQQRFSAKGEEPFRLQEYMAETWPTNSRETSSSHQYFTVRRSPHVQKPSVDFLEEKKLN